MKDEITPELIDAAPALLRIVRRVVNQSLLEKQDERDEARALVVKIDQSMKEPP